MQQPLLAMDGSLPDKLAVKDSIRNERFLRVKVLEEGTTDD